MNWNQITKEISFTAIRSRGPGGQNVNKVSSAARINWNPLYSAALSEQEKAVLLYKLENYLNKECDLILRSDEFRDLERNKARCLEKLRELLTKAFFKPKPRKKTRPGKSELKRRKENKQRKAEVKKTRRKVDY